MDLTGHFNGTMATELWSRGRLPWNLMRWGVRQWRPVDWTEYLR